MATVLFDYTSAYSLLLWFRVALDEDMAEVKSPFQSKISIYIQDMVKFKLCLHT